MPHFLVKKEEIKPNFIELFDKDTLFHIVNVRRAKIAENIKFIDEDKNIYYCKISEISKKLLKAQILNKEKSTRFLNYDIFLIQSILSPDGQNLLIANATQTGVKGIYPVISDNVSLKTSNCKLEKWQKIVSENFKQCERADMAHVFEVSKLFDTLKLFTVENVLIFSEKDINISLDEAVKTLDKSKKIALVIGPEGGFSDREFQYFKDNNFKLITLGNMIYKAPNAVVAGVSNIVSRLV